MAPIDRKERDKLVAELESTVKAVAHRVAHRVPKHIDVDDLIGAGMIGLLDAMDKFDTAKSSNFKKYAIVRVKGAILDEVRSMDPMGRSFRRKAKEVGRSTEELERQLGRAPSEEEVARHLGMDIGGFRALKAQVQPVLVVSVDELSDAGRDVSAWLTDRTTSDPFQVLEAKRVRGFLERQLDELRSERHALALRFYFFDGMSIREIAKVLGISESRSSQLMDEALTAFGRRIRAVLQRHGSPDVHPDRT
ncbi:MAG: FliA/WhiG family RNA polymerase sigma factor [Deltaproteobacteria bacterium]|nr:FliA/WhiG family RNA polymerase sigma factor [Deltaproteobacteria bacterium]